MTPQHCTLAPASEADEKLALVLSRYVDQMDGGVAPSPEQLLAEHPELGDQLAKYLDGLNWLQRAVGEARDEDPSLGAPNSFSECHLGDYRLVREIGRGGMGVVYEARQLSLGRTVALKLLPFSGLLDQKQIARFRNEAQAAAALHHPHIVPVFAVGHERGVHYYSMQFIDGQSLAAVMGERRGDTGAVPEPARATPVDITWEVPSTIDLARAPRPTTVRELPRPADVPAGSAASAQSRDYVREIVHLMTQAAEALQHAHECGVVHRDIKPSNLLLDRHGKLWITDFGLARNAIGPDLTVTGAIFGTMRYMSPEQAGGRTHLIDHRTDVYSLGITMFELLTLQFAFAGEGGQEILQRVQDECLPSLRSLNPAIPYDLETIVFKAAAKTREDRYSSARELADDLRRFLAGEPTHARRPTIIDRGFKWVARHKAISAGSFVAVASALIGVSVAAALLAAQRRETESALTRARTHVGELQDVVDRFGAGVSEKLRGIEGAESVRAELLRDTLACYETLLCYASHDDTLAEDAAQAAFKAAAVLEQLGEAERAETLYEQSRERFTTLLREQPRSAHLRADRALVENNLGLLLAQRGDFRQGLSLLREAAATQWQLTLVEPNDGRFAHEWAWSQINLGSVLADAGRTSEAAQCYRQAIGMLKAHRAGEGSGHRRELRLAGALHNLSGLLTDQDPEQAEALSRAALQRLGNAEDAASRTQRGLALSQLANLLRQRESTGEAQRTFIEAISLQKQIAERVPHRASYRANLAATRNNFGQWWLEVGDLPSAEAELSAARELFEQLVQESPKSAAYCAGLAATCDNLGHLWERKQDSARAIEAFTVAVDMQTRAVAAAPQVERYQSWLERHRAHLARVRGGLDQDEPAERSLPRASQPTRITRT